MRWITESDLYYALREELIWVILFMLTLLLLVQDSLVVTGYVGPSWYPQRCIRSFYYYDNASKNVALGELEIIFRERHQAVLAEKVRSPDFPDGVTLRTVNYRYNQARESLILYAPKPGENYEALDDISLLSASEKREGVMGKLRFYRQQGVTFLLRSGGGAIFRCAFL